MRYTPGHHPRKRMIQYTMANWRNYQIGSDYWMPAFAGMTITSETDTN